MTESAHLQSKQARYPPWSPPVWVSIAAFVVAFLLGMGALLAVLKPQMLAGENNAADGAARIFAGYLFSRNLSIATLLVVFLRARLRSAFCSLMLLTAFVQLFDVAVDCYERRWGIIPGVILIAAVTLLAANKALDGPVWKRDSWRHS